MVKSLEANSLKTILVVLTRWGNTYDMLLRLHRWRKVCSDLSETYKELCMHNSERNMIDNAVCLNITNLLFTYYLLFLFTILYPKILIFKYPNFTIYLVDSL